MAIVRYGAAAVAVPFICIFDLRIAPPAGTAFVTFAIPGNQSISRSGMALPFSVSVGDRSRADNGLSGGKKATLAQLRFDWVAWGSLGQPSSGEFTRVACGVPSLLT